MDVSVCTNMFQGFVTTHLHSAVNTRQTVRRHGVQEGPANTDTLCTEAESLDDIRGTSYSAINVDLDLVLETVLPKLWHDLGQHLNTASSKVKLATTVVAEYYAIDTNADRLENVFCALYTLQNNGHLGDRLEPRNVLPRQAGVDERGNGASGTL